jgi:hypothetical protein
MPGGRLPSKTGRAWEGLKKVVENPEIPLDIASYKLYYVN